uniref:Macaca fascicularis brain cDNA clone: QflA-18531, similar to human hypothetical protein FLJ39653 (FLJ39653), mRNA, RefSeq: NM_152684.1 n=1 Tax=Macaca fascicularis TaxID=9541 RepID=I7GIB0_MACFA|nr:unnamed protein product [Macaca fascicularis]
MAGACLPVFPATGRLRQENRLNPGGGGCSEPHRDRVTGLQPGRQSETPSQKKKKKKKDRRGGSSRAKKKKKKEAAMPRLGTD